MDHHVLNTTESSIRHLQVEDLQTHIGDQRVQGSEINPGADHSDQRRVAIIRREGGVFRCERREQRHRDIAWGVRAGELLEVLLDLGHDLRLEIGRGDGCRQHIIANILSVSQDPAWAIRCGATGLMLPDEPQFDGLRWREVVVGGIHLGSK